MATELPAQVEKLSPVSPGDMLIVRLPENCSTALQRQLEDDAYYLAEQYNVRFVFLAHGVGLERLDSAAMEAAGWVRKDSRPVKFREFL